jgi:hypothetical protein
MADIQSLETALVNADKAGDVEAAKTLATELRRQRGVETQAQSAPPAKIGAEGLGDAIKQVSEEFSKPEKFAIGAAGWVNSAAMRLKQILGRDLTPEDLQGIKEYSALKEHSGSATAGDIAMNLLATLNPAVKAQRAAAEVLGKAMPKVAAQVASTGATAGAVTAASQPITGDETTAGETAKSAGIAMAADVATRGVARAVQPIIQSDAVKKLTKEGIVPTIGQAAGGWVNKVEQKLESLPVIGDFISYARGRATKEFDEAAIQKALPAGTAEQIKAGRAGIDRAREIIDDAYDTAYSKIPGMVKPDQPFLKALGDIPKQEGVDLPPSLAKRFDALVKDRVVSRLAGNGGDAEAVRNAQNSLGALARRFGGPLASADDKALSMAFNEAKQELRDLVSRQSSPEFKATLDALDRNYSALRAVEKASGYQGSREGVFSAEALKRATTRSTSEMKDLSNTGSDVLGRTVPDSGTAGRTLLPLAVYAGSGGAASGNEYLGGPAWLTGALAAPLLYSRMGSRYAIGDYPLQSIISQTLRDLAPISGQVARTP